MGLCVGAGVCEEEREMLPVLLAEAPGEREAEGEEVSVVLSDCVVLGVGVAVALGDSVVLGVGVPEGVGVQVEVGEEVIGGVAEGEKEIEAELLAEAPGVRGGVGELLSVELPEHVVEGEPVGVALGVGEEERVLDAVGDCVPVGVGVPDGLGVGMALTVLEAVGEGVGGGEGGGDPVEVGRAVKVSGTVAVAAGEPNAEVEREGRGDAVFEDAALPEVEGEILEDAVREGTSVASPVSETRGDSVEREDSVAREDAEIEGEGRALGEVSMPSKCTQPCLQNVPQLLATTPRFLKAAGAPTLMPREGAM